MSTPTAIPRRRLIAEHFEIRSQLFVKIFVKPLLSEQPGNPRPEFSYPGSSTVYPAIKLFAPSLVAKRNDGIDSRSPPRRNVAG